MNLSELVSAGLVQISSLPEWAILLSKVTFLLTVSWLLHFSLARANSRWRVLLWRGVVVGLIVSFVWSIALPTFDIPVPVPTSEADATMLAASGSSLGDESPSVGRVPIAQVPTAPTVASEVSAGAFEVSSNEKQGSAERMAGLGILPSWQAATVVVWGLGVVLLFVRVLVGQFRLRHLLQSARPAPDYVVAETRRISALLGCRSLVAVQCSPRCTVPFLSGAIHPIITLPDRMCEAAYRQDLPAVLAHELAHARSSDVAWSIAAHATSTLLWFHPLVWRIGAAHRAACDAVCDAASASLLGDVQAYCRVLAKVALDACSLDHAAVLAMSQTNDVRRRVAMIQHNVSRVLPRRRAVVVMALFGMLSLSLLAGVQLTAQETSSESPSASPAEAAAAAAAGAELRPMRIRVLDRDGSPVVEAGVTVRAMTNAPYGPVRYRTDDEGVAVIKVPDHENLDLQLLFWSEGRVSVGAVWRGTAVEMAVPSEFTVEMEPGTSFGGIVRDERGKPIPGAEVSVDGRKETRGEILWYSIHETLTTDENGKWECHRMPADLAGYEVTFKVRHSDFASTPAINYTSLALDKLRDHSAVLVMQTGLAMEGTVTDPDGRPVAGAMVGQFADYLSKVADTTTDENGNYRLDACDPGEYVLAVVADGYAPNSRRVTLSESERSFDLQLQQGARIQLKIVDDDGKPLAGAVVSTTFDRAIQYLDNSYRASLGNDRNLVADAEGRWSRLWIAGDELNFYIKKEGFGTVNKTFKPDEQEQIVTLKAGSWSVSGRVVDHETKAPITTFYLVEGSVFGDKPTSRSWRERILVENEDGQYRASWDTSGDSRRAIRIEAEGYLPSKIRRLTPDEMQVEYDVELEKGGSVSGVVLLPADGPLAGAEVVLCTVARGVYLRNGEPSHNQSPLLVTTGADGRFSFSPPGEKYVLIVTHDEGFARVEGKTDTHEVVLQPWARVEGTLQIRNRPAPNERLTLNHDEPRQANSPRVHHDDKTTTDEDGHFVFEKVAPGSGFVARTVVVKMKGGMSAGIPTHAAKSTFVAGETTQVQLSRTGRPVVGRLVMPDGQNEYDWSYAMVSLSVVMEAPEGRPKIPWPKDIDLRKDQEEAGKWFKEWRETKEGKEFLEASQRFIDELRAARPVSFSAVAGPTGEFAIDDLPADEYQLSVSAQAEPKDGEIHAGQPIATLTHRFKVPEMPGGRSEETLDLGELTLEKVKPREARQ